MSRQWRTRSILAPPDFTTAWVDSVVANGGTVSAGRKTIVGNLINGLRTDGIFAKFDRLWLLAGENRPSALTDIASRNLAVVVGTLTFTTDRGFTGDFTPVPANYIDSGYRENYPGNKFTLNDCHISAWAVTSCAGGYLVGEIGHAADETSSVLDKGTLLHTDLTDANGTGPDFTYSTNLGHWLNCRVSSTALTLYQNGSSVATASSVTGSLTNVSWPWFITCVNNFADGQPENSVPGIVGAVSAGASFSAGEAVAFYNRLRTYMTAVGVP